jgi:malonyl-CoA O-methyltransferase
MEMEDSLIPILKKNGHIHPIYYFGNAEYLPIPEALDLVVSNAVIQWFSNQQNFISKLAMTLKKGSLFAFTTFAENNLIQCKKILDKGINYPSISNMDIHLENYFEIIYAAEEENVLWFSSPMEILRHLKETGVNSFSQTQSLIENETDLFQKWTRSSINHFSDLYHD